MPRLHVSGNNLIDSVRRIATAVNNCFRGGAYGTLWDDEIGDINAARVTGSQQPTWSAFRDGIYAWEFGATGVDECWLNLHVTHRFQPGTALWPHLHWSPGNSTNTGTVRWGIEWTLAWGHGQQAFPATQTFYLEQAASAGVAYQHYIAEVTDANAIAGNGAAEVDSILMMRIFRDGSHANDTFNAGAFLFFADMHYKIDRLGTPQKAPDYYKGII